jgi:DNA-directed RNA polymerase specialized sigma24 family protein
LHVTQESFESLLSWLNPDRDTAGQKYESIRAGLIRIFVSKGLSDAEYWTDETFDRVAKKLPEIRDEYVGEPVRYVYGVARNIVMEARRPREIATDKFPEHATTEPRTSDRHDFLLECLDLLSPDKRDLILDYHLHQGRAKIEHHRRMANELSISEGALRTRAHHIRVGLEKCVRQRLQQFGGKQKGATHHSL